MSEPTFTRAGARRPAPQIVEPLMQWATGLPTASRHVYAGWLIETAQDPALDDACGRAGLEPIAIRHGGGNTVTHWACSHAALFVLADGVQTMAEMRATPDRYGIAFGWRELPDGRKQSQLRMRVLVRQLLEVGYDRPLLVSVKSTLTGDLLNALMTQYTVLDAAAAERQRQGKEPAELPFYAFSLMLGPGQEVARGRGQTKEIVPMEAKQPEQIDRAYLVQQYIKREWVQLIEQRMDATIAWSVAQSTAIGAGTDEPESWEQDGERVTQFGR
jgi:hypothetical protein